jgi:hypothetical protein
MVMRDMERTHALGEGEVARMMRGHCMCKVTYYHAAVSLLIVATNARGAPLIRYLMIWWVLRVTPQRYDPCANLAFVGAPSQFPQWAIGEGWRKRQGHRARCTPPFRHLMINYVFKLMLRGYNMCV